MTRILPIVFLVGVAGFCALPYVMPPEMPTLATPAAEYVALVLLAVSVVAYWACWREFGRLGFLPVYCLGLLTITSSSVSWFGMPFIDAFFMAARLLAFLGALALAAATVARVRRQRREVSGGA